MQRRGVEKATTSCCWRNNAWIGVDDDGELVLIKNIGKPFSGGLRMPPAASELEFASTVGVNLHVISCMNELKAFKSVKPHDH